MEKDRERVKNRDHEEKGLQDKKQKELKQKPTTDSYYLSSPQYMPSSRGDTVSRAITDILVSAPDQQEDEKDKEKPIEEEDKDTESDRICLKYKTEKRENNRYEIMFMFIVYCLFITYI